MACALCMRLPMTSNAPRLPGATQEGWYVVRRVLAVAIESEGPFNALFPCPGQPCPERGTLAAVPLMPHHSRARRPGCDQCHIPRTVVHDDNEG